jgi:nucleotide-binding universal stress UspA family protein
LNLNPALIIVAPRATRLGRTATSIASLTGVPVLVARKATREATILAATDLENPGYPVLSKAARLGLRLGAPVVAIHNVHSMPVVVGFEVAYPVIVEPGTHACRTRSERLRRAAQRLPLQAEAVVRSEASVVEAILGEARSRSADIVVVGTRLRNWFDRLVNGSIAARVVSRAKRSVLVMPLNCPAKRRGAPVASA